MKKNKSIKLFLVLAGLFISSIFIGCDNNDDTGMLYENNSSNSSAQEILEKKIAGHLMDGNVSDSVPYSIVYNPDSFISGNNKVYSKEISKLCAVFSADVYGSISFVDRKEAYSSEQKTNDEYFAKLLGLTDITRVDLNPEDYEIDKNDVSAAIFSHQLYRGTDGNYEIIFVAIQGTNGSTAQWSSNFDIGADTSSYYETTGQHPDWINKKHAKGFDVPATRLDKKLQEFLASKIDKNAKKILVLTGHSRGAGIANILGAKYAKDSNYKTFTYCFASPRITTSSDYASYDAIFNVTNSDDLVTEVPMKDPKFGFNPYGIVKSASVEATYANDWVNFVNSGDKKNITAYKSANGKDCGAALAKLCDSRDEIYEYTEENKIEKIFSKEADESNFLDVCNNETFKKFIKVEKIADKKYTVKYCPGTLVQIFAFLISGNMAPLISISDILYGNERFSEVVSELFVNLNSDGVTYSHTSETYLLLADKLE